MSRLLICTVGTSLLTNARDDRPWRGWKPQQPLPDADTVEAWLATADPIAATAETNNLRALAFEETDRVLLLYSDTPEGKFCSDRLAALFASQCAGAESRPLQALSYHAPTFAQRGLKSLVTETLIAVRGAADRGLTPVLCATGGFKAETAFLTLLGALLEVEVCYIHELFRDIVRLPRLPLAWDARFVERHRDFFDWIDAEPRRNVEVEGWLRGRPELRPLVEDADDGNAYLNAAGDLLFRAARETLAHGPRALWPEASPRTPTEKDGLSDIDHHRPRGWERFIARLCAIDCVSRVIYDAVATSGPAVKVLDGAAGTLGVRYTVDAQILPLRIETTARGISQTELVAEYLRRQIR